MMALKNSNAWDSTFGCKKVARGRPAFSRSRRVYSFRIKFGDSAQINYQRSGELLILVGSRIRNVLIISTLQF